MAYNWVVMEKPERPPDPAVEAVKLRFQQVRQLASDAAANSVHKASLVLEAEIHLEERVQAHQQCEQEEQALRKEEAELADWLEFNGWRK